MVQGDLLARDLWARGYDSFVLVPSVRRPLTHRGHLPRTREGRAHPHARAQTQRLAFSHAQRHVRADADAGAVNSNSTSRGLRPALTAGRVVWGLVLGADGTDRRRMGSAVEPQVASRRGGLVRSADAAIGRAAARALTALLRTRARSCSRNRGAARQGFPFRCARRRCPRSGSTQHQCASQCPCAGVHPCRSTPLYPTHRGPPSVAAVTTSARLWIDGWLSVGFAAQRGP
jgi:hypothetical protein